MWPRARNGRRTRVSPHTAADQAEVVTGAMRLGMPSGQWSGRAAVEGAADRSHGPTADGPSWTTVERGT